MDRLRIFNRGGKLLNEFTAPVRRSWVIGKKTVATFEVPIYQPYCEETTLRFGNWVVVESDTFPDWVGTIASREWSTRSVIVAAYSPEFLLSQRIGPLEKRMNTAAGNIFAEIIRQANASEPTLLKIGSIYKSQTRQETINPTRLSDDLRRIYERSGEEYIWRAEFDSKGQLKIAGDWVKKLGRTYNFTLHEGKSGGNIEAGNKALIEDAPEGNYIFGYGNGLSWQSKPVYFAQNAASRNFYGLIQLPRSYYGVETKAGIKQNVLDELQITKDPARIFNVNALNVEDTYKYIGLGNTMFLRMQNIGFSGGNIGTDTTVRVVAMYYNPEQAEKIELALKEI